MNPDAAVRLREAAKTYRTGDIEVPALRGISLDIPYHRFSMVVGASGSGKSTLLNLIGCIDAPTRGTVEVCGEKVADLDDDGLADFRAKNIGFIFQTFSLIPVLSAYENVEYPLVLVGTPEAERRALRRMLRAAVLKIRFMRRSFRDVARPACRRGSRRSRRRATSAAGRGWRR